MTDHVSVETAEKLRQHGWTQELQPGDWVLCSGQVNLVTEVGEDWVTVDHSPRRPADCLPLPSGQQIMADLARHGFIVQAGSVHRLNMQNTERNDWALVAWVLRASNEREGLRPIPEQRHESFDEAAALAWLASKGAK